MNREYEMRQRCTLESLPKEASSSPRYHDGYGNAEKSYKYDCGCVVTESYTVMPGCHDRDDVENPDYYYVDCPKSCPYRRVNNENIR